jgi:hypothetical protein
MTTTLLLPFLLLATSSSSNLKPLVKTVPNSLWSFEQSLIKSGYQKKFSNIWIHPKQNLLCYFPMKNSIVPKEVSIAYVTEGKISHVLLSHILYAYKTDEGVLAVKLPILPSKTVPLILDY